MKISSRLLSILTLFIAVAGQAAQLQGGSLVPVRLVQNVNGNIDRTGETIYFRVTEDVMSGDELVIRKDTLVRGNVHEAVGRKSMGQGGKLTVVPKMLETENGQTVQFEENPLSAEGRKRTGATVAHVVVWGPLGLFAKGRAAYIFRDTEFDIEVERDVDLEPLTGELPEIMAPGRGQQYGVSFKPYKKKINYRKGKVQKDFIVQIATPNGSQSGLGQGDIRITSIMDDRLPQAIRPVSVTWDRKKQHYEASFAFTDIVRYIIPGTVDVLIEIGDDQALAYTASLETEWKLK